MCRRMQIPSMEQLMIDREVLVRLRVRRPKNKRRVLLLQNKRRMMMEVRFTLLIMMILLLRLLKMDCSHFMVGLFKLIIFYRFGGEGSLTA
jgi:hypothetical protein